jgi:hypothetical protein
VATLTNSARMPTFAEERLLVAQGYLYIAGVDEAGRGALAEYVPPGSTR